MAYREIKTMIKLKQRDNTHLHLSTMMPYNKTKRRLSLSLLNLFYIALAGQAFFLLARKKNQKRAIDPCFYPLQPEVAKF
jgi:hypothetical protein